MLDEELLRCRFGTRVLWLEGDRGVGKTATVSHFLATLPIEYVLLRASATQDEIRLPFSLIDQLARGLGAAGRALTQMLTPHADPLDVGAHLLEQLHRFSAPVVIVVEDVHWADPQSRAGLQFALRRLHLEPITVVLTSVPRADLPGSWRAVLADTDRVRSLELVGLTAAELVDLAASVTDQPLDLATAERLRQHTAGNPGHARALLADYGVARLAASDVLPAPVAFAESVTRQLHACGSEVRQFIVAAAVAGAPATVPLVAAISGLADPLAAWDGAISAGLLQRSAEGSVAFAHPFVRAAIYNGLPPSERRSLHLAAAEVTAGTTSLGHRVSAAGGADAVLADELERAAAHAFANGRTAEATLHFRAAARLATTAADRDRRLLYAAEAEFSGGGVTATRLLRQEIESCADSPQRSYVLACAAFAEGSHGEAERLGTAAMTGLTRDSSGLAHRAAAGVAFVRMLLGDWDGATAAATTALSGDAGWSAGVARLTLALCLLHAGRTDELHALHDRVAEQLAAGCPGRLDMLTVSGLMKLWGDDLAGACTDLSEVADRARQGERSRLLVGGLAGLAEASYRRGAWDAAIASGEAALGAAGASGQVMGLQQAYTALVCSYARRGQFDLAEARLESMQQLNAVLPWPGSGLLVGVARATLAEARADPNAMWEALSPALQSGAARPSQRVLFWRWMVLAADALLGTGDTALAHFVVGRLESVVVTYSLVSARADLARLRGRLAEMEDDLTSAFEHYESAVQAGGPAYSVARAQLALGTLQLRAGQRRAIANLRSARRTFAEFEAAPDIEACDRELLAGGVWMSHSAAGDLNGLTEAEATVAGLVGRGLSNRDVAARLFVTPKAVEYHLSHIYAKLGIRSRRQLQEILLRHAADDE